MIDYETLYGLYIEEGLTQLEVAKRLKTSNRRIAKELRKHGISKPRNYAVTSHGMSDTRQYRIWQGMKTRCTNEKEPEYPRYGGAGISYDPKWESFEGFWEDMSEGYYEGATLDRIDGKKDYTKDNCRWTGYVEQNNNRKNNVKLLLDGREVTPKDLIRITGLPQNTVYRRIREGWTADRIISTKPLRNNEHTKGR